MTQVIIFKQDNGVPAVIMPTQEALNKYGIQAIAQKDVPHGKPYKIVDAASLPQNVPQEAWVIDDADLNDGVGAPSNTFPAE
jgi:hypothetical protein